ncbi:DUF4190 domain-containing protein [Spongisporangium articulatum]|uniref:DUF4190 domain-containing protein n=1 Tax=Spongisporangium articulatum TaxID=3362603 RepID=A0ABW8AQL8_9ACTN
MDDQGGYTPRSTPSGSGGQDPYTQATDPYAPRDPFARPAEQPEPYAQPQYGQPYAAPGAPPAQETGPANGPTTGPTGPQYGQPAQPYAQQYGYAPAYAQPGGDPGRSGFAIAALVFGIIGGVLLSVIFAIVALRDIKRTGKRGRGMAIAGLVLSGLYVLAFAGLIAYVASTSATRADDGTVTDPGSIGVLDLKVGDCLKSFGEGTVTSLDAIPCSQPHGAQAVLEFEFDRTKYPSTYVYAGDAKVAGAAQKGCLKRLPQSILQDDSIGLSFLYPVKETWDTGDRKVTCLVTSGDDGVPLTKSYV